MENEIKEASLGKDLRLPGRLPSHQVAKYMQAADVLCLSSHNEGVPNVIIEAFASGLPILSTDVGGISEVLKVPEHGMLVPPGDQPAYESALVRLLDNTPDKSPIEAYAQRFSWEKTAAQYGKILQSALAKSGFIG